MYSASPFQNTLCIAFPVRFEGWIWSGRSSNLIQGVMLRSRMPKAHMFPRSRAHHRLLSQSHAASVANVHKGVWLWGSRMRL